MARVCIVVCLACLLSAPAVVGQAEQELFRDASGIADVAPAGPEVVRRRLVTLAPALLPATVDGRPAQTLILNLFDDVRMIATASDIEATARGYVWSGRLAGVEPGSAMFSVAGGIVTGTITTPDGLFTLRTAGGALYAIQQVNPTALPPELAPLIPDAAEPTDAPPTAVADDGSTIDLLVVYTPAARTAQGGTGAIESLIQIGVAETNQAYASSGVIQRVRLVYMTELAYTEAPGEMSIDLARLRNPIDGFLDDVHPLRDAAGADLVHLIVSNTGACGVAYLMTTASTSFASSAFGVTERSCVSPNYSFAHELGHNMGLHHDVYVTGSATGTYPYSHGYVNQAAFAAGAPAEKRWRDVMAYNDQCAAAGFGCSRLLRFGSPLNTHLGDPMGNVATADAVRSLNETRLAVSNFRESMPLSSFSVSDASVIEGGGGTSTARFTISLSAPSGIATSVTYTTSDGTAVSAGGTNTDSILMPAAGAASPYPSTITVPAGFGAITKATVTIRALSHSWPDDIDLLLVGPGGQTCLLMSDAGDGPTDVVEATLVFDDDGPAMPQAVFSSGVYRPTNHDGAADTFPAPVPAGPYGAALAVFNGTDPAGAWRLFAVDDTSGDTGLIAGGWTLSLATSSGADYVGSSSRISLLPGATSATVDIAVNGDAQFELPETFSLMLTASENAPITDQAGVAIIKNDDFTDQPLVSGLMVRTAHVTELRSLIDAVRIARGMSAFTYAESLVPQQSLIRATHVAELRTALPAACSPASYTDPVLVPGIVIKAAHITEIRSAAVACQ